MWSNRQCVAAYVLRAVQFYRSLEHGRDMEAILKQVIFYAAGPGGEHIAFVEFTDGTFGVAREGKPVDGMCWHVDRLDDCIYQFAQLTGWPGRSVKNG
jgi:hypothetical protein